MKRRLIDHPNAPYFSGLRPDKDPLYWGALAQCGPSLVDGVGCGEITRWVYMSDRAHRVSFALCPVCGRQYTFAWWKLRTGGNFTPTEAQEADVRALYADAKRMARGKQPTYEMSRQESIELHVPPEHRKPIEAEVSP